MKDVSMGKDALLEKISNMPDDIQIFISEEGENDDIDILIFTKPKDKAFLEWYFGP